MVKVVAVALALGFALVWVARESIGIGTAEGSSMEPTIHAETDRYLLNRLAYRFGSRPLRGDVVSFRGTPAIRAACPGAGDTYVKRVVGLPGERVWQRGGVVYVDGRPLSEPYAVAGGPDFGPYAVEPGTYFVLGDNRPRSCDSRRTGRGIAGDAVAGEVVYIWEALGVASF